MGQLEREAQQIAHNTVRERHHSNCKRIYAPAGELVSERSRKCTCWVYISAKELLEKRYGEEG